MTKPIDDFKDYIVGDILGHITQVTAKRMFGGYGLYLDGHIFAIITSDTDLYYKVDDTNRGQFIAAGSEPFVYTGHKNKKPTTMPYWIIPESILEDRNTITDWTYQSAAISKKKASE